MDKLIEEVLDNIIMEANDGINYNNSLIKFRTLEKYSLNSSYDDCIPVLIIRNKKELINKLKQYIELVIDVKKLDVNKNNIKKCLISLFSNACYEDYSNPSKFILNQINFYLNDEFMNQEKRIDRYYLKKVSTPISSPCPYSFKVSINVGDTKYYFPNINYGISEDICYIYGLEPITKNEIDYDNPNKEVLYLFLRELNNYGINKIKVVSYLPMKKENNLSCLLDEFNNLSYLYNNINIISNPFEIDEYMNIELDEFNMEYITCEEKKI